MHELGMAQRVYKRYAQIKGNYYTIEDIDIIPKTGIEGVGHAYIAHVVSNPILREKEKVYYNSREGKVHKDTAQPAGQGGQIMGHKLSNNQKGKHTKHTKGPAQICLMSLCLYVDAPKT